MVTHPHYLALVAGYPMRTALRNSSAVEREIGLPARALCRLDGDQRGKVLICRAGSLWITQQDDPIDYLLGDGDIFVVTTLGCVVAQALQPTALQVSALAPTSRASSSAPLAFD